MNFQMIDDTNKAFSPLITRRGLIALAAAAPMFGSDDALGQNPSDATCHLADGRKLGYRIYGSLKDFPVLYFHGTPGSRLEAALLAPFCNANGVCLIAVDRPGMGMSTFSQRHSHVSWPSDVARLMDLLTQSTSFDRFGVLAMSGGTSFALACTAVLSKRITATAIISPRTPAAPGVPKGVLDNALQQAAAYPRLAEGVLRRQIRRSRRHPNVMPSQFKKFAAVDRNYIQRNGTVLRQVIAEASRHGTQGIVHDMSLMRWPWQICLPRIDVPVGLWIGNCDYSAPPETLRFLHRNIPRSQATTVLGEGHFSIIDKAVASAAIWLKSNSAAK
ncbi:alpha/beta fold hydrolase [Roseiconus lacunae]|uniref:alpha/beta fold hydrolase n=1 Tax=Roseiconus lacunae TaxID=2605694 RepID=UPI001E43B8D1|nr:alpha/beta fold hydrolase [Roseiconus lacunae]